MSTRGGLLAVRGRGDADAVAGVRVELAVALRDAERDPQRGQRFPGVLRGTGGGELVDEPLTSPVVRSSRSSVRCAASRWSAPALGALVFEFVGAAALYSPRAASSWRRAVSACAVAHASPPAAADVPVG